MATMAIERPVISRPISDDEAWHAVEARDAQFDGRFVTGVRTTGIYCRPSCSARRPLRKNVTFFDTPDDAERAGLRACLRCKPRALRVESSGLAAIERARAYLDAH